MNTYLSQLVTLSDIDRQLDSFTPQIEQALKKVEKEQKKIDDVRGRIEELSQQLEENTGKIATYEEQISALGEQLASIQKKGREITTEKEMKALSLEEEIAKEKLTFANEEIERLNKVNDTKRAEIEELEATLGGMEETLQSARSEADKELAEIEKSKESLYKEREKIIRELDQKILAFYEKIRKWAGNSAVVPVRKQACYGCYLKISDKTYADVIKGEEIVTCPHCGRILYLEERVEEGAEA